LVFFALKQKLTNKSKKNYKVMDFFAFEQALLRKVTKRYIAAITNRQILRRITEGRKNSDARRWMQLNWAPQNAKLPQQIGPRAGR